MRIYVLGATGSGKSYLASRLAGIHSIPHIELDKIWQKHGGKELYATGSDEKLSEKAALKARILADAKELAAQPSWVMDGNYGDVRRELLSLADRIILLDVPFKQRLWNLAVRQLSGENRRRGYDWRDFIVHLRLTWKNRNKHRNLIAALNYNNAKLTVLTNRRDIDRYLN